MFDKCKFYTEKVKGEKKQFFERSQIAWQKSYATSFFKQYYHSFFVGFIQRRRGNIIGRRFCACNKRAMKFLDILFHFISLSHKLFVFI